MIIFYNPDDLTIHHCVFDPIPPEYAAWVENVNTEPYVYVQGNFQAQDVYLGMVDGAVAPFQKIILNPTIPDTVVAGVDIAIYDLVVPCKMEFDGVEYEITDLPLELCFETTGTHELRFYDADKKTFYKTVVVTP